MKNNYDKIELVKIFIFALFFNEDSVKKSIEYTKREFGMLFIAANLIFPFLVYLILKMIGLRSELTVFQLFELSFLRCIINIQLSILLFIILFIFKKVISANISIGIILRGVVFISIIKTISKILELFFQLPILFNYAYYIYSIFFLRYFFLQVVNEKSATITTYVILSFLIFAFFSIIMQVYLLVNFSVF